MKWKNVIDSSLLLSHFFSLPCFLFVSPFLLLLPCLATCFVVYVLAVLFCWFFRVNGKSAFAGFFGSIRKRRKFYMFLVMLSSSFFERFVWLLWGVVGGLSPLGFLGKEGTFCIIGLGKGFVYGVLEGWNSGTFCICYVTFFSFLFYLICLYWIVLKNSQCYCPLYLDR